MKVIIVGGGIAGLAAAIAAAKMQHQVLVFEQNPSIEERGAGLQIGPNGIKALDWLGAWDALRDKTWQPPHLVFMDGLSGELVRSIALAGSFDRRFGSPYLVAHRADLMNALLARARSFPGVAIETGSAVTGLVCEGEMARVQLGGRELVADAVVGADGVHSTVREQVLADGPPAAGHLVFRALLPRSLAPAISQDVLVWMYPGGHVVHYPIAGDKLVNVVAVTERERTGAESGEASPSEVAAAFPVMTAELRYLLGLPAVWSTWRSLDRRPVRRWGTGSVTLIGDAAHPMAPYLAQGAAAALEDSVCLGQVLDGAEEASAALREFEKRRMVRTARLCRASSRQARLYHAAGWSALLRNKVMRNVAADFLLAPLQWIYGWRP